MTALAAAAPTGVTSPASARAHLQARQVLERLMRRFDAETHLPADAHVPVRDAAFHQWLGVASGMLPGKLEWVRLELADLDLVPLEDGRERLCIALRGDEPVVGLVLADPFDPATRLWLESRLRAAGRPRTRWYVAPATEVAAFYDRLEQRARMDAAETAHDHPVVVTADAPPADNTAGAAPLEAAVDENPVLRFVGRMLRDALAASASDIHLSCTPEGLVVRHRIDGVLHVVDGAHGRDFAARVIRRLKVLADLDLQPQRGVQDGRVQLSHGEREIDSRLSILPARHGEDAVLRIRDPQSLATAGDLDIAALGFDSAAAAAIRRLNRMPHGLLLVTGPPGSGKTSTLYGLLGEQPAGTDRLITIEDPVEAPLADALQISVDDTQGMGFAHALRAALRHDADRLMLSELRDAETAQLAVHAALGGQRLYAAVHASHAFDAVGRLTTLGIDPWDLTAALNGVIAQRLLRKVCPHCAQDHMPEAELLAASGLPLAVVDEGWQFRRGRGCSHCRGSGYLGRQVIAQVLTLDLELKGLIAQRASPAAQREVAERRGLTTLRDAALELVSCGITTLEEANRVTAVQE